MPDENSPNILRLERELDRRGAMHRRLDRYYEGDCPLPDAVVRAKVTQAYQLLMPMAEAPWGSLVADSFTDRLEVTGVRSEDPGVDDAVWRVWQANEMDSESLLAHNSALVSGRAFALVWPDADGEPEISLDDPSTMIVQYREGSRRHRVAALRRWFDENGDWFANYYTPKAIYKYKGGRGQDPAIGPSPPPTGMAWQQLDTPGEPWPLPNPLGVLPVVELGVNRRLKPGVFPFARGQYENCLGLIDRINTLTFLGLVVAFWQGFPIRALIGDKILKDDEGNDLPPFEAMADTVAQFENPEAKLAEFSAADRENLSVFNELDQLATICKVPRHYFPMKQGMSNIAADTIRANEGAMVAHVPRLKGSLGEGWEQVLRLVSMILDGPALSPQAQLTWADHESRSLSERADAATKLKDLLPWQALAERVLNATAEDIARWEDQRAGDAITQLLAETANQTPSPAPEPVGA